MSTEEIYNIFLQHPIVTTDSRNCQENSIFFALKGDAFDGNKFAKGALEKGCSYAVIDNPEFAENDNYILVDDVLKSLSDLANHHRRMLGKPVIAITGTNGKTTTKELVLTALEAKYKVCATRGNFNNHIGLPLTILRANEQDDLLITEMGANHMGEIAHLCSIAEPDFGIITNIGKAHLEGFGSYENIIQTKSELYNAIKKVDGFVFINNQDELLLKQAVGIKQVAYGETESFSLTIENQTPFLELRYKDEEMDRLIKTNFIGGYNLINFKAAVAVGKYFDVETNALLTALEQYQPQNNRSQFTATENNRIIQDAYNANPSSVDLAIRNFEAIDVADKCYILGDMKELGEYAQAEHQKVADMLLESKATVLLIGEEFSKTKAAPGVIKLKNLEEAKSYLSENSLKGQLILLKGSRSMQLEKLIEHL